MKHLFVLILALSLTSCAGIARKFGDDEVRTTQVVHSEAGGATSLLTGRTSSCSVITDEDAVKVESMTFDASSNTCTATIGRKDETP